MADVTWIKLATGLPDNKKIKQIRRLPEGNTIALMWVFLLCLAGETNDNGMVYFMPEIPYTDEELADHFKVDIGIVKVALQTFQRFGMIEIINGIICIDSWEEHQNIEGMDKIREQNRLRKQRQRELQKQLSVSRNVTGHVTGHVTQCHATDKEEEKELEKELENKNILSDSAEPEPSASKKTKPVKHKYGEYNNVLLTDDELQKLKTEYSDYAERIENLSCYIASTGKVYKSHYATIRNWARKDAQNPKGKKEIVPEWMDKPKKNFFQDYDDEMSDFERQMLQDRVNKLKKELGAEN